jgi:hypothetical protein
MKNQFTTKTYNTAKLFINIKCTLFAKTQIITNLSILKYRSNKNGLERDLPRAIIKHLAKPYTLY